MTTKQSVQAMRQERLRLDQNLAKAATPAIAKTIRRELRRVQQATAAATTPAGWERAARDAVSDREWRTAIVGLWTSPRLAMVWEAQQATLGTDYPMPLEVTKTLTEYATEHAKSIAASQRDHYSALVRANTPAALKSVKGSTDPTRKFRSTMRATLRSEYAAVADSKAARIAWSETLQATESIRFESARVTASRTRTTRLMKVWFTLGDSHVRKAHSAVNGQSRVVEHRGWGGATGMFNVGGDRLRYPRDPNGSPGNVINCRCFCEYRKVTPRPGQQQPTTNPSLPEGVYPSLPEGVYSQAPTLTPRPAPVAAPKPKPRTWQQEVVDDTRAFNKERLARLEQPIEKPIDWDTMSRRQKLSHLEHRMEKDWPLDARKTLEYDGIQDFADEAFVTQMQTTFNFTGFDPDIALDTSNALRRLAVEGPDVAERLNYVGTYAGPKANLAGRVTAIDDGWGNTFAHASMDGQRMGFNEAYYGNVERLTEATERSRQTRWHPGNSIDNDSVVTHEWGHLHQSWLNHTRATTAAEDFVDFLEDVDGLPSTYAGRSVEEAFAELYQGTVYRSRGITQGLTFNDERLFDQFETFLGHYAELTNY